jgi:hypothetical protein
MTYNMDDDSTVKTGNISASAIHGEISAIQDEVSAERKKRLDSRGWTLMKHSIIWDSFAQIFESSQH